MATLGNVKVLSTKSSKSGILSIPFSSQQGLHHRYVRCVVIVGVQDHRFVEHNIWAMSKCDSYS